MIRNILTCMAITSLASGAFALDTNARPFTGKDASEVIGRELIRQGAVDQVKVMINGVREDDQFAVAPSVIMGSAEDVHVDKAHSKWDAILLMSTDGKNLAPVKLSGRYDELMHIPVLKQHMQNGDIITEEDIVWDDVPASHQRKTTVTDIKSLIGKSPKRMVSAGRPIRLDEITGQTVIAKGAQVTLIYKTPNLEIKTLGEAMENGAQGAVIKVRNSTSKAVIQGVVEGEGRVRIGSPDSLSAGLM